VDELDVLQEMNRIRSLSLKLSRSRIFWFIVGLATLPLLKNIANLNRPPTAFDAMGWVSHYQETKNFSTVLPDFGYSLKFPGDRDKFERFIRRMNLQDHRISDDEYKEKFDQGERRATFNPKNKGFEIEFTAYQI
jgi:hypothetical protein